MFQAINTEDDIFIVSHLNYIIGMKDYVISYTHTLGNATLYCYQWEVGAVLNNITKLALKGHKFSNVSVRRG